MHEPISACTTLLIVVTIFISWLAFRDSSLEHKFIFQPEAVLAGKEYYRLVTSSFLHSGWGHLLWNMFSLYLFGRSVEFAVGPGNFLLIYFGGMIGGDLLSLYIHRHHDYRAYGASGAVCGIIFAYMLLFPHATIQVFPLPVAIPSWIYAIGFIASSLVGMKENNKGNIGHDAHLGGAIVGFLITAALYPSTARANWKIFLIVLSAALLLLVYLWINPLFLPTEKIFSFRSKKREPSRRPPPHKREAMEIDAILEKISKNGMESLSPQEKDLLLTVSKKSQSRAESKKPESGLAI